MSNLIFSEVYTAHKGRVWSLSSRYVKLQSDKEDLLQEVFLNVHKALPRFRGEASLETWIYRITVNTAINYLKKQKRHQKITQVLGGLRIMDTVEVAESVDSTILKPLEKLNPQQRTIILLSDVEEKALDEIAEILQVPVGTVKSNLHRAREIVKKEVIKNEGL
ncbi:MAG: sigma-70 family RNA polymerase sigma factor [Candidatus Margulisbacteria bacterium]|nr:sigma-70 family RNA polymerase sigma factor [Candidatus Margulisiibacteriota bacterium]MBU1021856.1 sigma-70 family RNA polymerase sigma factor [Candidatus Margulisiibacteriota bacterium]MBU1729015.1 sigma-70 family RNA polymerase sigma factor [Candidatus Margulisiibacteriota bacterium]MBU1954432.1 sigma-70 family RNA polymerase sigma factor [Candidatus Margulisiibacteriota bacterium]